MTDPIVTNAVDGSRMLLETLAPLQAWPKPIPDPLKRSIEKTILELASLPTPRVPTIPDPSDFEALADYLEAFATIIDRHVLAVGELLDNNVSHYVAVGLFRDQLTSALLGNACYECTRSAERLREERAEDMA
jgi:hypothetical protein